VSDAGCRVFDFSSARLLQARYLFTPGGDPPEHYGALGLPSRTGTGTDALSVEFWWFGSQVNATLPWRATLAPTTLSTCTLCVTFGEGCTGPTSCQKTFLAQAGTVSVLRADRSVDAGALLIEGQRLVLREWARGSDSEVAGGSCVEVPSFSIAGTWAGSAVDAGVPPVDAGVQVDMCLTSQAAPRATLGCNGWASGQPAANAHSGSCMNDNGTPQGTCTARELVCNAPQTSNIGRCIQYCPASSSYITTGGCNPGYRCVRVSSSTGVCFRDCDATHACPADQRCDGEGSCVDL
jgi:hypothetical protein